MEALVGGTDDDLRRLADEVARIEREFEGAVKLTVLRDPWFEMALDRLNVRFRFVGRTRSRGHVDSLTFVPCRSFGTAVVEMEYAVVSPTRPFRLVILQRQIIRSSILLIC